MYDSIGRQLLEKLGLPYPVHPQHTQINPGSLEDLLQLKQIIAQIDRTALQSSNLSSQEQIMLDTALNATQQLMFIDFYLKKLSNSEQAFLFLLYCIRLSRKDILFLFSLNEDGFNLKRRYLLKRLQIFTNQVNLGTLVRALRTHQTLPILSLHPTSPRPKQTFAKAWKSKLGKSPKWISDYSRAKSQSSRTTLDLMRPLYSPLALSVTLIVGVVLAPVLYQSGHNWWAAQKNSYLNQSKFQPGLEDSEWLAENTLQENKTAPEAAESPSGDTDASEDEEGWSDSPHAETWRIMVRSPNPPETSELIRQTLSQRFGLKPEEIRTTQNPGGTQLQLVTFDSKTPPKWIQAIQDLSTSSLDLFSPLSDRTASTPQDRLRWYKTTHRSKPSNQGLLFVIWIAQI